MKWNYADDYKFEYETLLNDSAMPWYGHKFFAYDFVLQFKPEKIVELGSYRGTSLFAFSQAVKDHGLSTEIYGIDCWEGDEHSGYYENEIYENVQKIKKEYYLEINLHLQRMLFDDAVTMHDDDTIDLLHIDGLHTYEAVKNDFDNWLPKMKRNGVIFFHDIVVTKDDFGVFRFWDELKDRYKHLEFFYSYGLGVLFLGEDEGISEQARKIHQEYSFINKKMDSHNLWRVGHEKNKEIIRLKNAN